MRKSYQTIIGAAIFGSFLAMPAFADHMSVWGPGHASMPNDIHNTRFEQGDSMTSDEWRDFVSHGEGADVPNRYLDADDPVSRSSGMSGRVDRSGVASRGGRR